MVTVRIVHRPDAEDALHLPPPRLVACRSLVHSLIVRLMASESASDVAGRVAGPGCPIDLEFLATRGWRDWQSHEM
jgi:hypothetical protein